MRTRRLFRFLVYLSRTVLLAIFVHVVFLSALPCSAQECALYPIALSSQSLSNVSVGATIADILNGTQPGNFGWLSWAGSPSESTLVKSLTPPGDSATYVNPDNSADHQISVGDWIRGKPGVSNSKPVRDALNALEALDIVVPVWDQSRGQGERTAYRVGAFARVRLLSYQLPGQNRITVRFLGYTTCDAVNQPPVVDAGADQTVTLPSTAALNGSVTDDGLPAGGMLSSSWSLISGADTVTFGNSNATVTTAAFSAAGTYLLRLTATDSQLTNSDELLITVNRENHPPVASNLFMINLEDMVMDITLHGSDADGDSMSFSVVDDPSHGTLTGTPPDVHYTPFADFNGMDSFTFQINDGVLNSAVATVLITNSPINDPPVADSQSLTNLEDTSVTILLSGGDVEGAALTFRLVSAPTNGTLNASVGQLSTNAVAYRPNTNFHGADSFGFKVNDGEFDSAPATVAIVVQSVNDPPAVDAGPDQLITLPANSVNLVGSIIDDYFDSSLLVVAWTKVSGPGTVTFSNAFANATVASFSSSGQYVLRLTANDGFVTESDDVAITVNGPPIVNSGTNQIITLPSGVTLNGVASDDGLPTNGTFTVAWSKVSGPGAVVFADPTATNTTATFGDGGIYVLRLTASDGVANVSSNVTVIVNRAPIVDAGSDQLTNALTVRLSGTLVDDGLPTNGTFAVEWSKVSGLGTVVFGNPNATDTTATFSGAGTYVLRLTAADSLASSSDDLTIAINVAPLVNAGPDREVLLTDTFTLQGSVMDDGMPPSVLLQIAWSLVSGPGVVTIPELSSPTSTAAFSGPGVYVLRLTASDSMATNSDEVAITVRKPNEAPVVYAGQNQLVVLPNHAALNGIVTDDGLPAGASVSVNWSKVSGPGNVTFANPTAASTTASFSAAGNYVLSLSASDSELTGTGQVTIAVRTPAMNEAPAVSAGVDKVIGLTNVATFAGIVTDDGLPQGAALTVTWSKVSGPGTVNFENPNVAVARATFSALGTYVLRFTVSDTALTASDDVTVTVYPHNQPPVVDAGADQTVVVPDPAVLNASGTQPTNGYTELNLSLFAVPHWNNAIGSPGLSGGSQIAWSIATSGSNVYVAGEFTHANGVEVRGLGGWNGTQWFPLYDPRPINPTNPASPAIGFAGAAFQSVVARGNEVFVRGSVQDLNRDGHLEFSARWNGSNWLHWHVPITSGTVSGIGALAADSNAVYYGGDWEFTASNMVDGLPIASYGIARWNGTNFQAMARGVENGYVRAIAIAPNGDVYVAGNFTFPTPTGVASNIARWTGTNWAALGSGLNGCVGGSCRTDIFALGVSDNGDVYAGGNFTSAGGMTNFFLAKWDGATWSTVGTGINNGVAAIAADGRDVYVGGPFVIAGDFLASRVARWNGAFWSSLGIGSSNGVGASLGVFSLGVNRQGLYVGGQFTQAGGQPSGNIAHWEFGLPVPRGATLIGSAVDDGLPTDSTMAFTWTKVSGPGNVAFADAHSSLTTATFNKLGTYVLRLMASDSDLSGFDDVTVEVRGNQPPVIDAGLDQIINLSEPAAFSATVTDDGVTQGGTLAYVWTVFAAPSGETVTFQNRNSLNTAATFSSVGTYVLRLTANDGQFSAFDDVVVIVLSNNGAPSVSIGAATVVTMPASLGMTGFVSDDGRPVSITNVYWSQVSGPGAVLFSNANARVTWARFTKAGTYTLRLTVTDTEFSSSAQHTVTVTGPDQPPLTSNQSPTANAGADRAVPVLQSVSLSGAVNDDGLPVGSMLRSVWSVLSGPGTTYFVNATNAVTSVSLIATGTYVLRLAVNDSEFTGFDDVTLTVFRPTNQPPFVLAGPDLEVTLPQPAQLLGTVTDDGLPLGFPLTSQWSKVSGPGTVTFSPNVSSLLAQATFNAPGVYVLKLTANDTQFTNSSIVTITVHEGTNAPPVVDAGPDRIAALPDALILQTSATDDGLPDGALEVFWSQVSGPCAAYFSTVNGVYHANFTTPGTYVLRLTANDGELSASDDVTVTAYNAPGPPLVAILSPLDSATVTAPTIVTGTVSSVIIQNWVLEYRLAPPADSLVPGGEGDVGAGWISLATGTTPASTAPLGTFDPTLLLNGLYELRLTATDQVGRTSTTDPISLVVDRNMKVGHFTVSFKDLSIPVAGIPIEVIRTYDSRDKRQGDFGVGWTLDLKNIRLQKNRNLGNLWEETSTGGGFATYRLDSRRPRLVTITFPDGKAQKFQAVASPESQLGFPITGPIVVYQPKANTRGSLVSLAEDQDEVLVAGSVPGLVDLLEFSGGFYNPSRFQYTSAEGDVYDIDEREGLQRLTDRNGNTLLVTTNGITWTNTSTGSSLAITFQRDALSRITNIVDAAGNALTYRYDTNNHLVSFVDRVGLTNGFTYNARHELLTLTDARGIQVVRNEYDDSGRLVAQIDASGRTNYFTHDLSARREILTDRLGNVTVHWYDENGNVVQTQDTLGHLTRMKYDANDNMLEKVDALGNTNRFTYDARDNKLTETDPLGNTTRYTYDAFNQITSITNPRGFTTTNRYDSAGNLIEERDALGHVTSYIHDGQGNLLVKTDPLGNTVESVYDAFGNATNVITRDTQRGILNTTALAYDANHLRRQVTASRPGPAGSGSIPPPPPNSPRPPPPPEGEIVSVTYFYDIDAEGRLTGMQGPDGNGTVIEYNGLGKAAVFSDQLGRRTVYDFDERGNLFQVQFPDATFELYGYDAESRLTTFQDRGGRTTYFTNDALGRVVSTRHADGNSSHIGYDAIGRIIATTDERGFTTRYEYDPNCGCTERQTRITDPLTNVTQHAYDANGNPISMTDASGKTTLYDYDEIDRLVRTRFADGTSQTNFYDASDRQIVAVDPEGQPTYFGYDALDRLIGVTNVLGYATRFEYDAFGNLTAHTDAENRTTRYAYDGLGRRTRRTLPGLQEETYRYDAVGNVTNLIDFNGRLTRYVYDAMDRLAQVAPGPGLGDPVVTFTHTATGQRATMSDASGMTTYFYNQRDWLTNKVTPQGTLAYQRDAAGNVTRMYSLNPNGLNVGYEYDALNRLSVVNDAHTGRTAFDFDAAGNLRHYHYANGLSTTNQFNLLHWVTNLTTRTTQAMPLKQYDYVLNKAGKRTQANEPGRRAVVYGYDALYRLTSETVVGANNATLNVNYTYDGVGNRKTRGTQSYAYDANDRLLGPLYDANGNTTNAVLFDPFTLQFAGVVDQYDFEDRLATRSPAFAGNHVQIVYDGDGNRVRKVLHTPTNVITTMYLVDEENPSGYAQVVEELTMNSTEPLLRTPQVTRVYTYDYALLSQEQLVNGQWQLSFYGYDDQGNVRYLTDENGTITDTYDYDAFGNLIQQSGNTPNNYLFAGEQYDWDLGLYYLRARYLNPDTGRFWTRDPFEGFLDEPFSLNAYLYANGDPVNNWDPSGYETIPSQQFAQGIRGILEKVPRLLQRFRRSGRAVCKVIRAANKLQNAYATAQSAYERAQMARELAALGIAAGQQGLSGGDVMRIVFEEAFELKGLDLVRLRQFDLQDVLDTLDTPCFTAGTLVATEEGMRPIETLTMGDKVWALGQGTAELALKPITRTISREVTNTVVLTVGDERIEATAEHPFWVKDEGWIPAGMLKHGDKLRTRHGEWLSITSAELRDCAARVFNFEVKDTHTYFVGKIGTAVHNPSYREILNKTEQRAYALLQKKYPDWMPDLDAKASPRTPKQTQAARKMVKGKGHHCKPLAFGGDPNPREGLVKTGETRYKKNPTHKEVTNFWNSVLRRVRGGGR